MGTSTTYETVKVDIENVGGIDNLSLELEPGVTVLSGNNATNRTSTLRALAAVIGSNKYTSIKSDAEEGKVNLELNGEEYTRTLSSRPGGTSFGGSPLLDDPTAAENFAILLKDNDAREAIEQQGDLRSLVMEPVDIEKHEAKIDELQKKRARIEDNIQTRKELKSELPNEQEKIKEKERELEELREERDAKQAELDEMELDPEEAGDIEDEFEQKSEELNDAKSKRNRLERSITKTQEEIEALKSEIEEAENRIEELAEVDSAKVNELESEIERLGDERRRVEAQRSDLGTVIDLNEDLLDDGAVSIFEDIEGVAGQDQELFPELEEERNSAGPEEFNCPTCGQSADEKQIKQTLQTLRNLKSAKTKERKSLVDEIEEKRKQKQELEDKAEERRKARQTVADNESEIEDKKESIAQYEDELERVSEEVERLEQEREELKEQQRSEILSLQGEVSDLEFEIKQQKKEIEQAKNDLEKKEERLEEMETLEDDREEIKQEMREVRDTISNLEQDTIDKFNSQFEAILDILEYENIERIRLESKRDGDATSLREEVEIGRFEMTVVRKTDEGGYTDTYENLSESEQEVTGLLFALAGYLAHEVYKDLPLMLIDSVESIDSDRIAALVEHFSQYSDHLVIALLEDDADALPEHYQYIDKFSDESSTPALQ
jgi:DNA repair exonuclease SbcCD ATPase subunit